MNYCAELYYGGHGGSKRGVVSPEKAWENGSTITIGLYAAEMWKRELVLDALEEWNKYVNLIFRVVTSPSTSLNHTIEYCDVRISFDGEGAFSWVGTDALLVEKNKPTMMLGGLSKSRTHEENLRIVLHEVGHMLGLRHENYNFEIDWNMDKLYKYYKDNFDWSKALVDRNVLGIGVDFKRITQPDEQSIMLYPVDSELTLSGRSLKPVGTLISMDDIMTVRGLYPSVGKGRPS
jgi:serralysin